MSKKAEKRAVRATVADTPLPDDIAAFFANTRQSTAPTKKKTAASKAKSPKAKPVLVKKR